MSLVVISLYESCLGVHNETCTFALQLDHTKGCKNGTYYVLRYPLGTQYLGLDFSGRTSEAHDSLRGRLKSGGKFLLNIKVLSYTVL